MGLRVRVVEMALEEAGGGESKVAPVGSGCGSGIRTIAGLQSHWSLKLLPAWLWAHEGQAV